jgi:hypothetical protein
MSQKQACKPQNLIEKPEINPLSYSILVFTRCQKKKKKKTYADNFLNKEVGETGYPHIIMKTNPCFSPCTKHQIRPQQKT